MKKTIYYAHSMHLYGTKQEERDIDILNSLGFSVLNPSEKKYQEEFKTHNANFPNREDYMDYFYNLIVEKCDAVAFRAHIDGTIPSGVGYEIKCAVENKLPVLEIPNLQTFRFLNLEDTRLSLQYLGNR